MVRLYYIRIIYSDNIYIISIFPGHYLSLRQSKTLGDLSAFSVTSSTGDWERGCEK